MIWLRYSLRKHANDGDKSLVCAEKTLVDAAERHMQNIVPLYYEMRKAQAQQISMQSIYDGMAAAYSGGNIGPISNSISKIYKSILNKPPVVQPKKYH